MTFAYSFEQEDCVRWFLYQTQHSAGARRRRTLNIVFSDVMYFAVALFVSAQVQKLWVTAIALLFAVAFCVLTPSYIDRRVEGILREEASSASRQGNFGPHRLTISAAGLIEETPSIKSEISWESVSETVRDKDHVFIILSTGQAAVIGRHSYSGPVPFDDIPEAVKAFRQRNEGQPGAAPNGGSVRPSADSGVVGKPPSVS